MITNHNNILCYQYKWENFIESYEQYWNMNNALKQDMSEYVSSHNIYGTNTILFIFGIEHKYLNKRYLNLLKNLIGQSAGQASFVRLDIESCYFVVLNHHAETLASYVA